MTEKQPSKTKHLKSDRSVPGAGKSDEARQFSEVLNLLKPLTDFHRSLEDATQNDLRLYWDVRIVRGEDTPFCRVQGTSSQPAILAYNMMSEAPERIEDEVMGKIVKPLVSAMQLFVSEKLLADNAEREPADHYFSEEECLGSGPEYPSPQQEMASPEQELCSKETESSSGLEK